MKTILFIASAAVLTLIACAAPSTAADQLVLSDVAWSAVPVKSEGGEPRLRIRHKTSNSDVSLDGSRSELMLARTALSRGAGPVEFAVVHAAGTLNCNGTLKQAFEGEGRCRFTSDPDFERQLAARGLAPERRSDTLAMLLVDATIALADGLIAEGARPEGWDDLIAAAALKVTPAYVRELKSGAMTLTSIEDAIACKALGIDGDYVRGLTSAGYANLDADTVVSMKAVGVGPDYARAMNAARGMQ